MRLAQPTAAAVLSATAPDVSHPARIGKAHRIVTKTTIQSTVPNGHRQAGVSVLLECVMDTPTQINFDYSEALWGFVRKRFAFQAKQLKKLTGQPLAQCYELIAIAHGFSSWRGMTKVLDAMCETDRLADDEALARAMSGTGADAMPARLCLAISDGYESLGDEDEIGNSFWTRVERMLSRRPSMEGLDELDVLDGYFLRNKLRVSLFYKAVWMGQGSAWSEVITQEVNSCFCNLDDLWGSDSEQPFLANKAMFGELPEVGDNTMGDSPQEVKEFDADVTRILKGKLPKVPRGQDFRSAYLLADTGAMLTVERWRTLLRAVHPGSFDQCWKTSFVASLLLANGPRDAWFSMDLYSDLEEAKQGGPRDQFIPGDIAYAPSPEKAAQLGACLPGVPSFSVLTDAQASKAGLPSLQGSWIAVKSS